MVVCGEESEVVAGGVVRGEVGREKKEACGGWEQGCQLCDIASFGRLRCCCGNQLVGGGYAGSYGDNAWVEDGFILEMDSRRDKQLGELLWQMGPGNYRGGEPRPEVVAAVAKCRQGARGGFYQGVVDCGTESRPQVKSLLLRCSFKRLGWCERQDADKLLLQVWREV